MVHHMWMRRWRSKNGIRLTYSRVSSIGAFHTKMEDSLRLVFSSFRIPIDCQWWREMGHDSSVQAQRKMDSVSPLSSKCLVTFLAENLMLGIHMIRLFQSLCVAFWNKISNLLVMLFFFQPLYFPYFPHFAAFWLPAVDHSLGLPVFNEEHRCCFPMGRRWQSLFPQRQQILQLQCQQVGRKPSLLSWYPVCS